MDRPHLIWNNDGTGLMMEHSLTKVLSAKGEKANCVTSARRQTVTLIGCGSAAGVRVPPFYIFPGKRWKDDLLDGSTLCSAGTMPESGWSKSTVFMDYLEKHVLLYVSTPHPLLVLFDGHKSHVNLTLADWGRKYNIIFFVFPLHMLPYPWT